MCIYIFFVFIHIHMCIDIYEGKNDESSDEDREAEFSLEYFAFRRM